jgi:GntR family transcriptional regulator, transcriptional repressor for pyruvate dehydrogenase complex
MAARQATKKAHEIVADQLRQQIVRGELTAGDRLPPEDELTVRYGIARTTLREALRVLESQGLLQIRRGRGGGPVVTHPNLEPAAKALAVALQLQGTTIGDLDAARRMIEPQIAGQLARSRDANDILALEAVVNDAHAAAERNDPVAFGIVAAAMHETLMERSGNNTMATISKLLHEMVQSYYARAMYAVKQAEMRRAVRSYRKLIELIRAGDSDGAISHWEALMSYTIGARNPNAPVTVQ